jgi:hypothetical protein
VTFAIVGFGSKLSYTLDGTDYTTIAQLQRIVPAGSKQQMVDRTNILTADNFTRRLPVRVECDELDLAGVCSPQDGSQLSLGSLHAALLIVAWKILLSDNATFYTFSAAVSSYVPFELVYNKFVPFKAKLALIGGISGPQGLA